MKRTHAITKFNNAQGITTGLMSKLPLLIRGHTMEERVVPEPRGGSKSVFYPNQILSMMKAG